METTLTEATKISQEWLRNNRVMNLYYHMYQMERVSKVSKPNHQDCWLVVCSLQEDFDKRNYYVFEISLEGVILKVGMGNLIKKTIKLKEIKLEWDKDGRS